ncbi:MAG: 7,8-didemethyl-8-hydroxy-5-deazariboflavin synthase subunit CofH [Cyanobacteria bacterium SW_9_44_58]|nr:MAG: 7,8-didemethyl-8-hydroxy-5-deazariboflavin synthase subunit CofH [Cyanobacteria bacterium SW_9_44_58]
MISQKLDTILKQAKNQASISPEQGEFLLTQTDIAAREAIRETADFLRQEHSGEAVTYVVNRNINFTNICEQHCSFCAFRRDANTEGAYWLNFDEILNKSADALKRGATEICMQGGLNPEAKIDGYCLAYYQQLVKTIKDAFPQLHIHAFSPQEIQFIAREDGIGYETVIGELKAAGVGSMPGTAAEILHDRVRQVICPEKLNTQAWLDIISAAHRVGMPTTSTMLSGHIETPQQQIYHLEQLRSLQETAINNDYPGRITEFILLPFVGEEAPKPLRQRVGRDQPIKEDALHLTAVARIYLGEWIPNHQPSWVKLGLAGATEALQWGCNDIGGTLMEEHITTMAGAQGGTCMEVSGLQNAIASIGRPYQERNTVYQPLTEPIKTNDYTYNAIPA